MFIIIYKVYNKQCGYKSSWKHEKETEEKACFSFIHQIAFERFLLMNATWDESTWKPTFQWRILLKNTSPARQMDRVNTVPRESEQKRISLLKLCWLAREVLSHRSGKEMLSGMCRDCEKSTQALGVTLRSLKWKHKEPPSPQEKQHHIMAKTHQTDNPPLTKNNLKWKYNLEDVPVSLLAIYGKQRHMPKGPRWTFRNKSLAFI